LVLEQLELRLPVSSIASTVQLLMGRFHGCYNAGVKQGMKRQQQQHSAAF